jgi:hypothetical protein
MEKYKEEDNSNNTSSPQQPNVDVGDEEGEVIDMNDP